MYTSASVIHLERSVIAWQQQLPEEAPVKVRKGKLKLGMDVRSWLASAAAYPGVVVRPLDLPDAVESSLLPGRFHDDPADRMIIAVARRLYAPLITADRAIRRYPHVKTIW